MSTNASGNQGEMMTALLPYQIEGSDKTRWNEVGVAFPNRDGKGITVLIKPGLSVSGKIVVRPIEHRERASESGTRSDAEIDDQDQGKKERRGFEYKATPAKDLI